MRWFKGAGAGGDLGSLGWLESQKSSAELRSLASAPLGTKGRRKGGVRAQGLSSDFLENKSLNKKQALGFLMFFNFRRNASHKGSQGAGDESLHVLGIYPAVGSLAVPASHV